MEELKFLLNNFIVYRENNKDIYYAIKDNYEQYKELIENYLKYKIIVRSDFIKLEKFPGNPHFSMGIKEFKTLLHYDIFLDILYFLDSLESGSQFLFSELRESIKLNWLERKNWLSLKVALEFAISIPIIKEIDRSNNGEEVEEILLENIGNSRFIISTDYLNNLTNEIPLETRVYRDLIMKSAIYSENIEEYEYCKKHKEFIAKKLEDFLGWKLHIYKNFILPVPCEKAIIHNKFPDRTELCKFILQFNKDLRNKISNNDIKKDNEDIIKLDYDEFLSIFSEIKEKNGAYWTKKNRDLKIETLVKDMLETMKFFNFIKIEDKTITCYPLCGKIVGGYSEQ